MVFWVGEASWRSQRAMEKIGGVSRPGLYPRQLAGTTYQHVVFEIRKGGFKD